jgi:hypothetical protein
MGLGIVFAGPGFFPSPIRDFPEKFQKRPDFRIISLTFARRRSTLPLDVGHQVTWTTFTERTFE